MGGGGWEGRREGRRKGESGRGGGRTLELEMTPEDSGGHRAVSWPCKMVVVV